MASPSTASVVREKCSRNKRKFRGDLPSPHGSSEENCEGGMDNRGNDGEGSNCMPNRCALDNLNLGTSADCKSLNVKKEGPGIVHNLKQWFRSGQGRGLQTGKCDEGSMTDEGEEEEDNEFEEEEEYEWDDCTEGELEDLLMKNLENLHNDAINKIVACGHTRDEALRAVLKHGRHYGGKDALVNIVGDALGYLTDNDEGCDDDKHICTDLKELQKQSLSDMVRVLRGFRPSLSRGDAMWCLLMCDMNVAHVWDEEDGTLPAVNKESVATSISSPQSGPGPSSSLSLSSTNSSPPSPGPISSSPPKSPVSPVSASTSPSYGGSEGDNLGTSSPVSAVPSQSSGPALVTLSYTRASPTDPWQLVSNTTSDMESFGAEQRRRSPVRTVDCALTMGQPDSAPLDPSLVAGMSPPSPHTVENGFSVEDSGTGLQDVRAAAETSDKSECEDHGLDPSLSIPSPEAGLLLPQDTADALLTAGDVTDPTCKLSQDIHFGVSTPGEELSSCDVDQLETDLQIGSSLQPVSLETTLEPPTVDQDTEDLSANETGVAETELSLSVPAPFDSSSCSDGGLEASQVSTKEQVDIADNQNQPPELDNVEEGKDETLLKLQQRVTDLETQLQERTEWAQQKVMQAARRLSKDLAELKALRAEREEGLRLKKEQKALEDSTMKKLTEMENALRKASGQVDRANTAVRRLEHENAEMRAEMEAAKLSAAESVATYQEVAKREKKGVKRAQAWERQKAKLQEDLSEERRKVTQIQQQLAQAKERQQQAEVRWRQEEKSKEEAVLRADMEKRAKEQAESAAKRREESSRRKAELDFQRHQDDMQRLEREIAGLRVSAEASQLATSRWGPSLMSLGDTGGGLGLKELNARLLREVADLQDSTHRDIRRDRECVMCMCEEMSVVFLPCAHQVICTKCNDLHEKQGMRDCPSCRTPIQQRIRVYGVSS